MPQIEQAASRNRDSETTGGELRAEEEEQLPVRWVAPRLERKSGGRRLAGSRVRLAFGVSAAQLSLSSRPERNRGPPESGSCGSDFPVQPGFGESQVWAVVG
jgi:hypothetical protein